MKLLDYNLQHFVEMYQYGFHITVPVESDINISLFFEIKLYIILESMRNCRQCYIEEKKAVLDLMLVI